MTYIIEQANVKKTDKILQCSITIKENKINYISPMSSRMKIFRMDASPYLLTSGHVMLDTQIEHIQSISLLKEYIKDQLIKKGCTTILVSVSVDYERQLLSKLKQVRHLMINSPLDYCLGIKIPIRILTPSLIRLCKRSKIPVIFTMLNEHEIDSVPWGWIRDAMYPYYPSIVPMWTEDYSKMKMKRLVENWKLICEENQIPTIPLMPTATSPLSLNVIKKIGIYPLKGDIRIGGDVDYNLYERKSNIPFDIMSEINYHMDEPIITVHKGRNIKVGDKFYINPGFGQEMIIKVPGFFASSFS